MAKDGVRVSIDSHLTLEFPVALTRGWLYSRESGLFQNPSRARVNWNGLDYEKKNLHIA